MIIKKVYADFGKLCNAELEFSSGFNYIFLPNEGGKSTWCAFIRTMLYGFDTRDRDRQPSKDNPFGYIADKNRFVPWQGGSMQGKMLAEHNGKEIEIIRKSGGKGGNMSIFSAADARTGQRLNNISSENCGEFLCGASEEVYLKTAFIQSGSIVCAGNSSALESKINSIISSGQEDTSASFIGANLNKIKNSIRANAVSGALPEAEKNLAEIGEKLDFLREIHKQKTELCVQKTNTEEKLEEVNKKLAIAEQCELWDKYQDALKTASEIADANETFNCAKQQISEFSDELTEDKLNTLRNEISDCRILQAAAENAERKITESKEKYRLAIQKSENFYENSGENLLLLPLLLILTMFTFFYYKTDIYSFTAFLGFLALIAVKFYNCIKEKTGIMAQQQIVREQYEYDCAEFETVKKKQEAALESLRKELAPFKIAAENCENAERELRKLEALFNMYRQAASRLEILQAKQAGIKIPDNACKPDAERPTENNDILLQSRERLEKEIAGIDLRCAELDGRLSSFGDFDELLCDEDKLCQKICELKMRLNAVILATEALNTVAEEIRAKIASPLAGRCAEFIKILTNGKYSQFRLEKDFHALCGEKGALSVVSASRLSDGTLEQIYLALRLAMCELALSDANPPIILDDALLSFDEEREKAAIELLKEIAEKRQVILFSCRQMRDAEKKCL